MKAIQAVLQVAERKFRQVFHTRWLSFDGAISAIVASLDPLYAVLVEESHTDPVAKGILTFTVNFSFLATTYLLADVLPILSRLSKRFKRSQVDFTTVTDGVGITVSALTSFKTVPGPKLVDFLSKVPPASAASESFYFMGHRISDSKKRREDFESNKGQLMGKLVDNLKSRFPESESGVFSSFSVLDPQNFPAAPDDLRSFLWQYRN